MSGKELHRLLRRQLKKSNLDTSVLESLAPFLDMVNEAYHGFDTDVVRLETILEESSKELFRMNRSLRHENEFAKSKLKTIVNSVHGVLFQTDLDGKFVYLNKAWDDLTGLSRKRSLGKNYRDLLVGMNKSEKLRIENFLKEKRKNFKTVFKYYKPNKEVKWIDLNLSISYDHQGNAIGTTGTMIDVTSLKETEIELNRASQAKDEFLSTMSHEIRTPLNAVIGLANILLMEVHLPEQAENLMALKYSGEHLLELINNILDLNKIHSGKVNYVEAEFSLDDMIEEIQHNFKLQAKEKYLVFRISKDKDIPDRLLGDRLMLIQVLKNLLSNAFKFTDQGVIHLSIESVNLRDDQVSLKFTVNDTGIGIPPEKQKAVFNRFVQAEKNTSRIYGGTGLGLTISKKILEIQNSQLNLISQPGKGSSFWFKLDFKVAEQRTTNRPRIKENKTTTKPISLKVLVAEDNKLNQMVLSKLLARWGVFFKITNNGQELLDELKEEDYDLVLMDLQMPVMDGYETAKRIRNLADRNKNSVPIIALTAFAQDEARSKSAEYEMNGFMTKPFDPNEFHKLLNFYGNSIQNVG